jgi:hypothetical protein
VFLCMIAPNGGKEWHGQSIPFLYHRIPMIVTISPEGMSLTYEILRTVMINRLESGTEDKLFILIS